MSGHPKNGPPPTAGPIPEAGARNGALEDAAERCEIEAHRCLGDIVAGDSVGAKLAHARAGALMTVAGDIRALKDAPPPQPPAPTEGAPDVGQLLWRLLTTAECGPNMHREAADALTAQAAEISVLRTKVAGTEAAVAAIEPDTRDLIANISARIEAGVSTEVEADCRDALRAQAAALDAARADTAKIIAEIADDIGCEPDNEAILRAIGTMQGAFCDSAAERDDMLAQFDALRASLSAKEAECERLKNERDQFMEQAAMRDNRDADMQAIMGANNGLKARIAELEAALRLAQEWIARVTADTDEVADYLNGDRRDGVGGRCGWDDGVDVLKKVDAALARKEAQP